MSVYKNKVIASKPYIARGNDTSEDKKLCSNCLKKGCNISYFKDSKKGKRQAIKKCKKVDVLGKTFSKDAMGVIEANRPSDECMVCVTYAEIDGLMMHMGPAMKMLYIDMFFATEAEISLEPKHQPMPVCPIHFPGTQCSQPWSALIGHS